uniref:Taste receptor type 2 n=1 Tax=Myripristis murdjan TaxID=586833 RepID=A0A668AP52_9TELE
MAYSTQMLLFHIKCFPGLKQPLKTLLGFLVWCMIIFLISLPLMYGTLQVSSNFYVYFAFWLIVKYTVCTSMTSCVWLSFYYHSQIVPARRAISIWVKKNITYIIYTVLFLDRSVFLFDTLVDVAQVAILDTYRNVSEVNSTWMGDATHESYSVYKNYIILVYSSLCLCMMMVCSFSTAHYLPSLSSRRFRSQMRVTITGTIQGLLYLLYELWSQFNLLSYTFYLQFAMDARVTYTFSTLQMCGTTINMAVGQTVFRRKAADVWTALKSFFCVDGTAGNDVKFPVKSSQPTPPPTIETGASTSM